MGTSAESFPKPNGPEKITYQGRIIEVVQQPMLVAPDKEAAFEVARRSPGVRLIVLSPNGTKVLLSKEYRKEVDGYDYRLPGGKVFDKLDEYNAALTSGADIAEAAAAKAKAEGREEVGLDIHAVEPVAVSKLGATMEWDLHYFKVTDYQDHPDGQALEAGEDISREWVTIAAAQEMALGGQMSEERSALILLRTLGDL